MSLGDLDLNLITMLKSSYREAKDLLTETKKLKNIFIIGDSYELREDVTKLQELEASLSLQQDEANTIFLSISKALEETKTLVSQRQKQNGKLRSDAYSPELIRKKFNSLIGQLSSLKNKAEAQKRTFGYFIEESRRESLELLKEKISTDRSSKDSYLKDLNKILKKRQQLDEMITKKTRTEWQIERLDEDINHARSFVEFLKEEITKIDSRIVERIKEREISDFRSDNGLAQNLKNLTEKKQQDYNQYIQPIDKKMKELLEGLEQNAFSNLVVRENLAKKFHFIFIVDNSSAMREEKLIEAKNCINALFEDRKDGEDIYSFITFSKTVRIITVRVQMRNFTGFPESPSGDNNNGLLGAFSTVCDLIRGSKFTEYVPIAILLTKGTKSNFIRGTPISNDLIQKCCTSVRQIYESFKNYGFHLFVSEISSCPCPEGLRQIVKAGNGEIALLKCSNDIHDFFNKATMVKTLPKIFRDLENSLRDDGSDDSTQITKLNIEIVQESIAIKEKFLDDNYNKQKASLEQKWRVLETKSTKNSDGVRNCYEEQLETLWQEKDKTEKKIRESQEKQKKLRDSLPKQANIISLENEIGKELKKKEEDYQSKAKEQFAVINPERIDVNKSIMAFEKLKEVLVKRVDFLICSLNTIAIRTGQISSRLVDNECLLYESLLACNTPLLGTDAKAFNEIDNMMKMANKWFGFGFDKRLFNCFFNIVPVKVVCNFDKRLSDIELDIIKQAEKPQDKKESELKEIDVRMDDVLSKINEEHDAEKKKRLLNDTLTLMRQKEGLMTELELLRNEGSDSLKQKMIKCFTDLRGKIVLSLGMKPNKKPEEQIYLVSQCIEIQNLVKRFAQAI